MVILIIPLIILALFLYAWFEERIMEREYEELEKRIGKYLDESPKKANRAKLFIVRNNEKGNG